MQQLIGSTLYIMGGFNGYEPMSSIEKADLSIPEPQFVELPRESSLASPLKNAASLLYNGKIYIIGGWDDCDTSNSIYEFDPVTEQS